MVRLLSVFEELLSEQCVFFLAQRITHVSLVISTEGSSKIEL